MSMISDRDLSFTSRFWGKLQETLGTWLNSNTTFHPQTDGQSERVCETQEQKKRQNGDFAIIVQTKIWKNSRSRMTKWTSSLNSSCEI